MRVGGLAIVFVALAMPWFDLPSLSDEQAVPNIRRTPVVEVFEKTHGAVVNISSTKTVQVSRGSSPFDWFFEDFQSMIGPRTRRYKSTSVGSGFVVHENGYIITNAHVVDRTTDIRITLDDRTTYQATIVAQDRDQDLALLKIDAHKPLPVIGLGDSDDLMIGETVIAIGNPLGYQHTLTTGVISATRRDLELSEERTGRHRVYAGLIQTDAGINPGNSGGPLLNVLGELIGINTAIRGDAQNIGFAIPVNQLRTLLPVLVQEKQKNLFTLGLRVDGARRITHLETGSPAARAGLRLGDIITRMDGHTIRSDFDFYIRMLDHRPGQVVVLDTQRAGTEQSARVRLQEPPRPDGAKLALGKLGMTLSPLTPSAAHKLGLPANAGLLIAAVERGGPAHHEGIEAGDILTILGRFSVSTLEEVGLILADVRPREQVYIRILRLEEGVFYRYHTRLAPRDD